MLTQHAPRVPHRPALPHGIGAILTLVVLALITAVGIYVALQARPTTPNVEIPAAVSHNTALGIYAPPNMELRGLPRGYTDYLLNPPVLPLEHNVVPGIVLQPGMQTTNMPRGYTDYLLNPPVTNPTRNIAPGIMVPLGMRITGLPRGYTDYLLFDLLIDR